MVFTQNDGLILFSCLLNTGGQVVGPAINHFQQVEALFPPFWYLILGGIGIVEGYTISRGWEGYSANKKGFADLKAEYIPGK